jgi:homeobox-leucine zipper protein
MAPASASAEKFNMLQVTWIVNMEYDETNVLPMYRPLLRSGKAFGACRWLASLQRQSEYFAILHTKNIPGNAGEASLTIEQIKHEHV